MGSRQQAAAELVSGSSGSAAEQFIGRQHQSAAITAALQAATG